jgi:hypothetical protein
MDHRFTVKPKVYASGSEKYGATKNDEVQIKKSRLCTAGIINSICDETQTTPGR